MGDDLTSDPAAGTLEAKPAPPRSFAQALAEAARTTPSGPLTARVSESIDPATREKLENML